MDLLPGDDDPRRVAVREWISRHSNPSAELDGWCRDRATKTLKNHSGDTVQIDGKIRTGVSR
ncbi:hypothetical protein EMGBS4_19340 [Acidimicrobiaceae bacterium]|nr:hypothetical protein EMGBS4_19340 [Acidimicrobiaceae bacterium]